MVKLQKNPGSNHHFLTLPETLRKAKDWEKSQELQWKLNDNNELVLKEK